MLSFERVLRVVQLIFMYYNASYLIYMPFVSDCWICVVLILPETSIRQGDYLHVFPP